MSKRNSPEDPEPDEEPKRAAAKAVQEAAAEAAPVAVIAAEADPVAVALGLVPRRPFVLRPVEVAEAEVAGRTRREANRALNARVPVVVDLTNPEFEVDDTLVELPDSDEEADGTDVEADVPVPPHGTEGQYAGLYHGSPTYSPVSPAYQHDDDMDDDVYVPSSAYVMSDPPEPMPDADFAPLEHFAPPPMPAPEDSDSDEDFAPPPMPAPEDSDSDEDGNSGVLGPGDESE